MATDEDFFINEGYQHVRFVPEVGWCGITPMLFTTGVFIDLDEVGPRQGRYCFSEWAEAVHFLKHWDGVKEPTKEDGLTANKRFKFDE